MRFQWGVCKKPGTRQRNRHRLNELLTTLCPPHRLQDKIQTPGHTASYPPDLISHCPVPSLRLPNASSPRKLCGRTSAAEELPPPLTLQSPSITDHLRHHSILVFPPPSDRQPLQSGASSTFCHFMSPSPLSTDFSHSYLTSYSNFPFQVKNVQLFQTIQVFPAIAQSKFQPLSRLRDFQAWF